MKLNKIFGLVMIMILSIVTAHAGSLISDQTSAGTIVDSSDKSNIIEQTIFATDNLNITINNFTFTYDVRLDLRLSDAFYFLHNNNNINGSDITIHTQWGTDSTPELVSSAVTMEDVGEFAFVLNPGFEEEFVKVYIDYPDEAGAFVEQYHYTRERGIGQVTNTFVSFTSDLVEINISLWRLAFYVVIIILFLSFIVLILTAIFKIIEFAEKLGQKKKKHIYGGRKNE